MKLRFRLQNKGREFLAVWRDPQRRQSGKLDIGGMLLMGIGMVFLAVGFIMYPIVMDATDELLDWVCVANTSMSTDNGTYTGFEPIIGIVPLLVLVGYLSAAVFAMFLGVRIMKTGEGGTKIDLGAMLLMGIAMIFIAIGLIILPVTLEAICGVISNNSGAANTGQGLSADYVGLGEILAVTPLLILISFVSGAVISGFFGLKRLGARS